jgi:hypothetical protein
MSGPAQRPAIVPDGTTEFEPVVIPQYTAQFSAHRADGESIVSVTIVGSPRIVDQIMHSVSDAFREEVEI